MKIFAAASLLILISIVPLWGDCEQCCESCESCDWRFQEAQIELGYSVGKYISIDKNYSTIGLFVPLTSPDCYSTFLDVYGYRFNDGKWAASAGVGIRQDVSEFSTIGINAYYDYRRGEAKHNFNQIGIGIEWLNGCWDFRANGYLPISKKTQTSSFCNFDQLGDGFFATRRRIEYAYSGFDAEIGFPLLNYCDFNLYGAAGPYYYQRSHFNRFFGGYGRLELNWKSFLTFQVRMSHDKVYSTKVQGMIQISFPLDYFFSNSCRKEEECCQLIYPRVRRNGIILTDHCCDWTWNWDDRSDSQESSSH